MENLPVKAEEFGIEEKKATDLTKGLSPVIEERELLIEAFKDVSELEVNEENIPTFKDLRLKIVKNRTQGINKWHKSSKEFFLAGGRFVDAIKNKENQVNEEMESKLMSAEKHFENLEKERINKLQLERASQLEKYIEDISHINLGEMDDDIWDAYFNTKKSEYEARIEEEKRLEEERVEKERKENIHNERKNSILPYWDFVPEENKDEDFSTYTDKEWKERFDYSVEEKRKHDIEQVRIKAENERLKKEREADAKKRKEAEAKKEAEHQAQLKKEREAREKLEREERKRKEAEADKIKTAKEERERLEKAPIKEKMNKWVNDFELPETSANNKVSKEIKEKFEAFKKWSINQVNNL